MLKLLDRHLAPASLVLAGLFLIQAGSLLPAQEEKPAPAEKPSKAKPNANGYKLQDLDNPAEPLEPKKPRTPEEQNKLDALTWYMTGQLLEKRNELSDALDAYKKAVDLDPKSAEITKALVLTAFSLNQTEEAVKYALKAIELDPDDYQVLRRLAVHMANERKVPQAIELLEKALESPKLKQAKATFVMLNRDLAILYMAIGDQTKAADSFEIVFEALQNPKKFNLSFVQRKSLEANPTNTYEQIGEAFIGAQRPKLAVQAFEAALKARRGKPGTLSYNLAKAYLETGENDKALEQIQTYFDAQLQTKGRDAYELLAKILKAKDQKQELITRLEKMAEADSRNYTLQYFLAEQYLEGNQLEKAEALYKKTLDGSKDPEGYAGLASVYRRLNKPEQLFESLTQAVESGTSIDGLADEFQAIGKDEKLASQLIELAEKKAEPEKGSNTGSLTYFEARVSGKIAAAAKKPDAAVKFYELAKQRNPGESDDIYEDIGMMYFDLENYAKAAEWYRKGTEDSAVSNKVQFLYRLSQAEELAGNTDAALVAVKKAQAQLPQIPLLHYQEGWILYHAKRYDDAIEKFDEVTTKFAGDKEIVRRSQFILSSLYVQQGNLRKGEEVLEKILAEDPQDPSVNNDLGYLYADHGKNLKKAKSMIQIALTAEPENPAYLDSMGWVLYKLGEYKNAVSHLEKAVKLPGGGDSTIWDHLADCYARLKQMDKAQDAWQKALEDAKKDATPDEKLIKRIEQKLAAAKNGEAPDLP